MKSMHKVFIAVSVILFTISVVCFLILTSTIRRTSTFAIYDVPSNKLWHHATNDTSLVNKYLVEFGGIEFDVNYDYSLQNFDLRHD